MISMVVEGASTPGVPGVWLQCGGKAEIRANIDILRQLVSDVWRRHNRGDGEASMARGGTRPAGLCIKGMADAEAPLVCQRIIQISMFLEQPIITEWLVVNFYAGVAPCLD